MKKKKEDQVRERVSHYNKGELETHANAYTPGLFTSGNAFNTQATRDVANGKSGTIGNTKAGDAVYNPKSKARLAVEKAVSKRIKHQAKQAKHADRNASRLNPRMV